MTYTPFLKAFTVSTVLSLVTLTANATHLLGSEIRYSPTADPFTYLIEVRLYSDLSAPADRPAIRVDLGLGVLDTLPRTFITDHPSAIQCGPVRLSQYIVTYTYPGEGVYTITYIEENRSAGIINIPNSAAQASCVRSLLTIDLGLGPNHSIVFDTLQFQLQRNWNTLAHDPGAFDADGDSLVFDLVVPDGLDCLETNGYTFPVGVEFTWCDPETGIFLWSYPSQVGRYVIAISGSEYRNGQLIGQVTRDMTICVGPFFVGMNEADDQAPFLLYPSLTDDLVSISNRTNAMLTLDVISANGTLAGTYRAGPDQSSISLGHLAPGIYSIRAKALNGEVLYSTRIVRQ